MFINDIFCDVETSNIIATKEDVADMDVTLARIIIPMLIELRDKKDGIPSSIIEECFIDVDNDYSIRLSKDIWNEKIQTMIDTFIHIRDVPNYNKKDVEVGLYLFAKHYLDLWC